ncbi:glycosyltransferase [Luminiphilus sp.]|nr:glycosyltransferase [Luminiphilus sp.]
MNSLTKGRIQVIIDSFDVGGTEIHIVRTFSQLVKKGYCVSLLTFESTGNLFDAAAEAGIEVLAPDASTSTLAPPALFSVVKHLHKHISRDAGTIVCVYLPRAYLLAGFLHLVMRLPSKLVSFRRSMNNYQTKHRFFGWLERRLHSYTNFIVANSKAIVKQLESEEGVSPERLKLVYNGIDITPFHRVCSDVNVRQELCLPDKAVILVVVANLIPYKGHDDLLRAISLLTKSGKQNAILICAGDGLENRGDLLNLASQLGVEEQIFWLGSRWDIPSLLAHADIGVLPSHEEGFSNAVLEGMAASLPMVVTNVGGNAEAVIDGETGLVVPSKNPKALAAALEKLILDKELRQSMGSAGLKRVHERFSLDACVDAYEALFNEVLGSR